MYKWLFVFISLSASASPLSDFTKVGIGEAEYLFWTIYRAEYYRYGRVHPAQDHGEEKNSTQALKIEYFESISRDILIDVTIEQWDHLGYTKTDIDSWSAFLRKIWPNVDVGNTLTVIVTGDRNSQFYFNGDLIGTIEDRRFGKAFLSIWLSENTSYPELRLNLLGNGQ